MTDSNRGFSEVPALIAERRQYESWLAALDARRDSTPAHVFERVQGDYRARLQRVAQELASHRQAIEEERTSVESRLSLLEAEERMRRDERAELELRSHVGELAGEEASLAFGAVDEAIAKLVEEKAGLTSRIDELNAFLEIPEPTPSVAPATVEPVAAAREAVQAAAAEPSSAPRLSGTSSPVSSPAVGPAVARSASPPTSAQAVTPMPSPAPTAAPRGTPERSAPTVTSSQASGAAQAPSAAASRPSEGLRTPSGSFDELKFLNAVIGKEPGRVSTQASQTATESAPATAESASGAGGGGRDSASTRPFAANVPGNTPIVLRPSVALDQSKTLKCSECGATNYPTEWYCERCGAELAAL